MLKIKSQSRQEVSFAQQDVDGEENTVSEVESQIVGEEEAESRNEEYESEESRNGETEEEEMGNEESESINEEEGFEESEEFTQNMTEESEDIIISEQDLVLSFASENSSEPEEEISRSHHSAPSDYDQELEPSGSYSSSESTNEISEYSDPDERPLKRGYLRFYT